MHFPGSCVYSSLYSSVYTTHSSKHAASTAVRAVLVFRDMVKRGVVTAFVPSGR